DMIPALALGAEKPEPDAMQRPPRSRKERLIDWPLLAHAYLFLGPMEAVAAMAAFLFVLLHGGWAYGEALLPTEPLYLQATAACLTAIIIMQVANVFLCRSEREPVGSPGLFRNPLLWAGIATELGLILWIDYTSLGSRLFGTAPPDGLVWLVVLPFALAMFAAEEIRKVLVRGRRIRR